MTSLLAATPLNELRIEILNVVIGSILLAFGTAGLAISAVRWKRINPVLLNFGVAVTLYGFRLLGNTGLIQRALPALRAFWPYQDAFITYVITVPALLFAIDSFGPGLYSSLKWMLRVQIAYSIIAILIDLVYGPLTAMPPNNIFVILSLILISLNGAISTWRRGESVTRQTQVVLFGAFVFALFGINHNLVGKGWVPWSITYEPLGMFVFVGCLGYFMSHRYFNNERQLLIIESENRRQAQELDEARQLQLSMLPRVIPQPPGIEIAAFMKTATEVGGDYYDFLEQDDGALTIVIGDATGHGLKAGTMVTAVKSLIDALAQGPDIALIFQQFNRTLKRLNLRGLFMAMTMVKVKENRMVIGAAGMPPLMIYKASQGNIEESTVKAPPLGSIKNFAYRLQEFSLQPGDIVILMSDGLPERFNHRQEMLDYDAIKETIMKAGSLRPQEMISTLVSLGERWADGAPLDDDMTFVVFKMIEIKS